MEIHVLSLTSKHGKGKTLAYKRMSREGTLETNISELNAKQLSIYHGRIVVSQSIKIVLPRSQPLARASPHTTKRYS